ncbi:MAG: aldo/keto reductase [Burkholderiaceae bacterium]|nr:aldo/keto reductase [Burkholderiaceae bacterium]
MSNQRPLGPFSVMPIGLGCMNVSHAYSHFPDEAAAGRLLLHALDRGVDFFDTAALYGFGENEKLLGRFLKPHRNRFVLASKCGMTGVNGKRVIDGRPETIKATCDDALKRLQTEVIDLYYLHRLDFNVPIEDSVGALADLVAAGKIRGIGLSEVSGNTIRRAQQVHPIMAVQNEYSLWTREPEISVIDTCHELGVVFVAFSPLGRGFFAGELTDPAKQLQPGDIRFQMPRFEPENYAHNLALLSEYRVIAAEVGCSLPQLALAWILNRYQDMLVIPGTRSTSHLDDNLGAANIILNAEVMNRLDRLINNQTVIGERYNAPTQKEIDTEQFPK